MTLTAYSLRLFAKIKLIMQETQDKILEDVTTGDYKYGFVTDIETEVIPIGLNEDVVRLISAKKK